MDAPNNKVWGRSLWIILHTTTEKINTITYKRIPNEEKRLWMNLLKSLQFSLPCPLCKSHYRQYYANTPIYTFNKDTIRKWLFDLHCQVNNRNNIDNIIKIDDLPMEYSTPINYSVHMNSISREMLKSLRIGWTARIDMQRTIRCLEEIKRFYDYI